MKVAVASLSDHPPDAKSQKDRFLLAS